VKDGDSLVLAGREIRLSGIDAPELKQICQRGGKKWQAGQESAAWLESRIAGKTVSCVSEGRDQYRRIIATCYIEGQNLNEMLVRDGWAIAYRKYSDRYITVEAEAKAAKKGIWSGECETPEAWRHRSE
jgi:endonuclease YncB( thermonuclease family)